MPYLSSVVIGSSRGLGLALTRELLARDIPRVIGIARTPSKALPRDLLADGRYRHVTGDISSASSVAALQEEISRAPAGSCLVIYNAAILKDDIRADGTFDFAAMNEINAVGVMGFQHCLQAVAPRLIQGGGTLAGISSFSALAPPTDPRIAYGATKVYLDMALETLRLRWQPLVNVSTIYLGGIGGADGSWFERLARPSYARTARYVADRLLRKRPLERIDFPYFQSRIYRWLVPFLSPTLYRALRSLASGGEGRKR